MGLKLFYGDDARGAPARIQMIQSFTDNRGNEPAMNKLMSDKYPSSAIVMELATSRGCRPRQSQTATPTFKESDVWLDILPEALQKGREVERECQRARTEGAGLSDRTRAQKRRRPEDRLQGSLVIPPDSRQQERIE